MDKLSRDNLWSLEQYHEERPRFREQVIAHKKARRVSLGDNTALYFEDFLTMKYQVQEMLRVERIFASAEIAQEIETYNPLIPDGNNWKATMMIEFADVEERRAALARMVGIEHRVWVKVGTGERLFAVANEDLARSTDEKTSAVHFLRFEFDSDTVTAIKAGTEVRFGIDHEAVPEEVVLDGVVQKSLANDLG
ncbi:MAG: DUF3501 family protein [Gammaproteobacteria bacterium]|nr:DUF3501 family protein [Gammaproteobacteria bacterium]